MFLTFLEANPEADIISLEIPLLPALVKEVLRILHSFLVARLVAVLIALAPTLIKTALEAPLRPKLKRLGKAVRMSIGIPPVIGIPILQFTVQRPLIIMAGFVQSSFLLLP
jgi:hypothetical protein